MNGTYRLLFASILVQGLSGVAGGLGLASDPSGARVGLHLAWLEGTPFTDYLVPGVILCFVLGVFPLVVAWGLWVRRSWAWYGSLIVGMSLAIWIVVEILMIGYKPAPPLQVIYGLLSLLILGLAAMTCGDRR